MSNGSDVSRAVARCTLYGAIAECFVYPDAELLELIRSGTLSDRLRELLEEVAPSMVDAIDWEGLKNAGANDDELKVEYTRLFDTGTAGPVCPLIGGHYIGSRMHTMEETVRFYNHFGLSMAEQPNELPDHLATQLEFMHFMTFQESGILKEGADPSALLRAQRDFLARHPGRWVPMMLDKLESARPKPYFRALVRLLDQFMNYEVACFVEQVGKVPTAAAGSLPILGN